MTGTKLICILADPLNQGRKESGAALLKKTDASPEEQAKDLEKKVHEILEQSAMLTKKEDYAAGLEKAMEAKKRERALNKVSSFAGAQQL